MKKSIIIGLIAFLSGIAVVALWQLRSGPKEVTNEEATILLERIRNVTKLVTVEGDVSELYQSTASKEVTFYLPLPTAFSFDKKALVEVRGTVLVGYDLEQLDITVDAQNRRITIANLPEPSILAIDHETIFRNLEESWFNTFTAEDYSKLNRRAKERLHDAALESALMESARKQGNAVIDGIEYLARGAGFEVVVEGRVREAVPAG